MTSQAMALSTEFVKQKIEEKLEAVHVVSKSWITRPRMILCDFFTAFVGSDGHVLWQ